MALRGLEPRESGECGAVRTWTATAIPFGYKVAELPRHSQHGQLLVHSAITAASGASTWR